MEVSCKELFSMFQKSTGKLVCSYIDKKCIFEQNTMNISQCNIQPENSDELDTLYLNFSKKNKQYFHKYYGFVICYNEPISIPVLTSSSKV
jgi:hypothetical protein